MLGVIERADESLRASRNFVLGGILVATLVGMPLVIFNLSSVRVYNDEFSNNMASCGAFFGVELAGVLVGWGVGALRGQCNHYRNQQLLQQSEAQPLLPFHSSHAAQNSDSVACLNPGGDPMACIHPDGSVSGLVSLAIAN